MGIMIIPFVSSLSDDVITAVPQALRDGSYALGRDALGDDSPRRVSGRAAGHRRRSAARRLARDRRDDDRRDGRRARRESHGQSARGRDDGDGADRDAADGRPGVRQRRRRSRRSRSASCCSSSRSRSTSSRCASCAATGNSMSEPLDASVKEAVARGLARRYRNERMFPRARLAALLIGLGFSGLLLLYADRQRLHGVPANAHRARRDASTRRSSIPTARASPETLAVGGLSARCPRGARRIVPRRHEPRRSARVVRAAEPGRRDRAAASSSSTTRR